MFRGYIERYWKVSCLPVTVGSKEMSVSEEGVLLPETDTGLADMCKL